MFVVVAEQQAAYPIRVPGHLDVYGPFDHPLQAKDFAQALQVDTGAMAEVKPIQPAPTIGDEGL